jgi:hypothetical protein
MHSVRVSCNNLQIAAVRSKKDGWNTAATGRFGSVPAKTYDFSSKEMNCKCRFFVFDCLF